MCEKRYNGTTEWYHHYTGRDTAAFSLGISISLFMHKHWWKYTLPNLASYAHIVATKTNEIYAQQELNGSSTNTESDLMLRNL